MMIPQIKADIVEHAPVYLTKFAFAVGLLGITTVDFIDVLLRAIAGILAAVVTIWTIKRMSSDIAFRTQETKEKIIDIMMKEEQLKQHIIENEIRSKELQKLIDSTKIENNEK